MSSDFWIRLASFWKFKRNSVADESENEEWGIIMVHLDLLLSVVDAIILKG